MINQSDRVLRARRLSYFCKEVKRAIAMLCLDESVPLRNIDFYIEEFFVGLDQHPCEYQNEILLLLLHDEDFIMKAYLGYLENVDLT